MAKTTNPVLSKPRLSNALFLFFISAASALSLQCRMAIAAAPEGAPLILYTDIVAGPNAGGENGKGAYLSIFGKNFGNAGLGESVKVFIGGVEVDNYRYLGTSKGRSDIQQITVQVGALGDPTPGQALPIKIVVADVSSNTDHAFTVQPGDFLFVDPVNGNDASAVVNDIAHPWKNAQTPSDYDTGAIGMAGAGDTIVLRGGNYDGDGWDGYWLKIYRTTGVAPEGQPGQGYLAITAYPGEEAVIHPMSGGNFGVISGGGSAYSASYVSVSNLAIVGGSPSNAIFHDGPVNLQILSDYWRVVNNDLSCPYAPFDSKSGGITGDGRFDSFLGNHIHDTGEDQENSGEENHGIYIDSGNDIEVAYNHIHDIPGGSAIQTYNSSESTPFIFNIRIHHNLIHDVTAPHGINIGDTSSSGIEIYDNVIYRIDRGGIRNNSSDLSGCRIFNNVIYDAASRNNSPLYAAIMSDANLSPGAIEIRNNIVCPFPGVSYLGGSVVIDQAVCIASNNLWFNGSDYPGFDAQGRDGDPLFVDPANGNFRLRDGSPAIDHGASEVSNLVGDDYDLVPRPKGGGFDIGAFER